VTFAEYASVEKVLDVLVHKIGEKTVSMVELLIRNYIG